ncbi:4-hydroxybutyrate coenzyme A transferase [Papilio machaon]|uniref:4-hydroxybutyrate coenzyme A transferase n=1 Tax=Papilio machaon TaxID=76193 RepID=A0A0N1PF29_PAPMA|nr:4-hydroxybutyrate coenzyme A transferase [Papilio machaon]
MSVMGKVFIPNLSRRGFVNIGAALQSVKSNNYFTYTQELSQPLDRKPERVTAEEAFKKCLKSGQTVYAQGAAATPVPLLNAMTDVGKSGNLRDIKVVHMHTEKEAAYVAPECKDIFSKRSLSCYITILSAIRCLQIPDKMFETYEVLIRCLNPDIKDRYFMRCYVSPPDQHGYCSLGTSVDCVRSALVNSKIIIGIGSIPDAVLSALKNHKVLGIHSEMFSVGVIDLVRRGCVTNNKKKTHKGRIVGSFLVGNRELYDFVDNNPFIEMLEIDYVNNTHVVSLQPTMTAINSCIEVDLTGQVCADSIGQFIIQNMTNKKHVSLQVRGKPIIALVSTTKKNETKIVPTLKVGAGVVTTRAHVHYVVTEQGIAYLFGKTLRQRAYELIKIAHPDHREALEKAAFERLKCMPAP